MNAAIKAAAYRLGIDLTMDVRAARHEIGQFAGVVRDEALTAINLGLLRAVRVLDRAVRRLSTKAGAADFHAMRRRQGLGPVEIKTWADHTFDRSSTEGPGALVDECLDTVIR